MHKLSALVLALSPVPAMADTAEPKTPTGGPEAVFQSATPAEVSSKIASACFDQKWDVLSQSEFLVECSHGNFRGWANIMLAGNDDVRGVVTFSIAKFESGARVRAAGRYEVSNAFGQISRESVVDDEPDRYQIVLLKAGGAFPPGTTFDGNWLGIYGFIYSGLTGKVGFTIAFVDEGSPAALAGLRPGDSIRRVNGKSFKTKEGFTEKVNAVPTGSPIQLTFQRESERITINVIAEPRMPVERSSP